MVYGVIIADCLTNIVFPDAFLRQVHIAKEIIREHARTLITLYSCIRHGDAPWHAVPNSNSRRYY